MVSDRVAGAAGGIAISIVGAVMCYLSWLRWPDVIVDFGRELYVPWQLASGASLYTDVHYWNGPLSPYINALLFTVFGESVFIVELSNLVVIGIIAYLAYRIYSEGGDRISGMAASMVFLAMFAFAQYYWTGNFNFMAPYSHELTHGTLLAFVAINAMRHYVRNRRFLHVGVMGLVGGLAVLTKIEITLGVWAALVVGLFLTVLAERPTRHRLIVMALAFLIFAAFPPVVAIAGLGLKIGFAAAIKGIFGSWLALFGTDVSSGVFQRAVMGTDDAGGNIVKMLRSTLWYAAFILPLAVNHMWRKGEFFRSYGWFISLFVYGGVLVYFAPSVPWFELARPWPLFVVIISLGLLVRFLLNIDDRRVAGTTAMLLAMCAFSFVMLLKMMLNVKIPHYGFALAMPATLVVVYALTSLIPSVLRSQTGYGGVFRGAAFAAVAVMAVWFAASTSKVYAMKTLTVGEGADRVISYNARVKPEGAALKMVLDEIERTVGPDEGFVVMPEGVMLNFLARRPNPTGYINFVPTELLIFGTDNMIEAMRAARPGYVVLVHKDTSDYGVRFFGRDYGEELYSWVARNYQPVFLAGAVPLQGDDFGIMLLKRRD